MKSIATPVKDVSLLWEQYNLRRDNPCRELLLLHYLPLVRLVAGRMKLGLPGSVEFGDLVNTGLMGLVGCIDGFSPEKGFKFETYAVPRIRGAILDGLRDVDWLPRSYRQKGRQLDQAVAKLVGTHGRVPTDDEVALELGLDGDEFYRFMDQAGAGGMVSLDLPMPTGEDGETGSLHDVIPDDETPDPLERLEANDARDTALKLVDDLNEQERAVVALYYYEELTFKEIGWVLGVSESRVCQIHTKLIATLRARLHEKLR